MNAKDWRFPMACPACDERAGAPQRATSEQDSLALDLRCGKCGHEWTISAPSPPMFLKRKPDTTPRRNGARVEPGD